MAALRADKTAKQTTTWVGEQSRSQAASRAVETADQTTTRLAEQRTRQSTSRAAESSEQWQVRHEQDRIRSCTSRAARWTFMEREAFQYDPTKNYDNHPQLYIGRMAETCSYYDGLKWPGEAPGGINCSNGKIKLSWLRQPPESLESLMSGTTTTSRHFLENIRKYNSCFQMLAGEHVSAKESNSGSDMEDENSVNSEEQEEEFLKENIKEKVTTTTKQESEMDSSKESSDSAESTKKADPKERDSTPMSNGSKSGQEEPSSTNLPKSTNEDDEEENNTGDSGVSSPGDSKKDVQLKSPSSKEVKREPIDSPKSPNGSPTPSETSTEPIQQPALRVRRSDDLFERGEFEDIDKLVQQPKQEASDELYMCSVCPDRFSTGTALEAHMARTGHYSVSAHPDPSQSNQGPMQQLAQQVQRIPASFNSQPYRPDQPPPYGQNSYGPQRINMLDSYPLINYLSNLQESPALKYHSGPQVKLTPVGQTAQPHPPSLPNLPPGVQLQKRPAQHSLESSQTKQRRSEDAPVVPTVKLPSAITLVRPGQPPSSKKSDNNVADILANRGITMIPSGGKSVPTATSRIPAGGGVSQLNSSVSITPSSGRSQQQAYVGRGLPTVDLTSDPDNSSHQPSPHHPPQPQRIRNRIQPGMTPPHGRPPMRATISCQLCDKAFNSQEALNQHLPTHRGVHKLPFECKECTAQYPTAQGLAVHKQKYHRTSSTILDMAIPVVDLKQNGVLHKLTSLGVRNFIPLAQLHNQQNTGQFCLPIVSVELANNPAFCNISGIGASNLLPLGPLKNLPP